MPLDGGSPPEEGIAMANDDIEVGESVEITELVDDNGNVIGTVVDDVMVVTSEDGSIVEETIDVFDADATWSPRRTSSTSTTRTAISSPRRARSSSRADRQRIET